MRNFAQSLKAKSFALSSAFFIGYLNLPINKVEAACPPGEYAKNGVTCSKTAAASSSQSLVKKSIVPEFSTIYNSIAIVLLATTVLTIITAGLLYMTSKGDPKKLGQAKTMLLGSGFAIIVLLSSYTIYRFFIGIMTGGGTG